MFDEQPDGDPHGECAAEIYRLQAALTKIARWHGEFPDTGMYWDEPENTRSMSYSAAFGSNGERDYMRQVALDALGHNAEISARRFDGLPG